MISKTHILTKLSYFPFNERLLEEFIRDTFRLELKQRTPQIMNAHSSTPHRPQKYHFPGKSFLNCRTQIHTELAISIIKMHYDDVITGVMASQITSLTIVYSTVYSGAVQRTHQSSASLAFVWGIHRAPVNFPHKWPVTRKIFPFDDVIMGSDSVIVYMM